MATCRNSQEEKLAGGDFELKNPEKRQKKWSG